MDARLLDAKCHCSYGVGRWRLILEGEKAIGEGIWLTVTGCSHGRSGNRHCDILPFCFRLQTKPQSPGGEKSLPTAPLSSFSTNLASSVDPLFITHYLIMVTVIISILANISLYHRHYLQIRY